MIHLAKRIAQRRKAAGLSQAEAAAAVGATLRNYQRWEAGETLPHLRQLPVIASGLGTTVSELIEETDDAPRSAHELAVEERLTRIEEVLRERLPNPSGADEPRRAVEDILSRNGRKAARTSSRA